MHKIKELIVENFSVEEIQFNETDSLFRGRILDSVDLVQLVAILEDEFDISISPREIVPSSFDTIEAIHKFVDSKLS